VFNVGGLLSLAHRALATSGLIRKFIRLGL
jgi:hypothetical protein